MDKDRDIILSELERVQAMLYKNEQLFDLAESDTDTDALIYEHKALMIRYSALIAKAKEYGIKREGSECPK